MHVEYLSWTVLRRIFPFKIAPAAFLLAEVDSRKSIYTLTRLSQVRVMSGHLPCLMARDTEPLNRSGSDKQGLVMPLCRGKVFKQETAILRRGRGFGRRCTGGCKAPSLAYI